MDDHSHEDKAMQAEVTDMGGADPEYMHLDTGTPQEDFDSMWAEGDTITQDGYLAEGAH